MVSNQLKNQHLLWRAGFGPMAEEIHQLDSVSTGSYVKALMKGSSKPPVYIDVAESAIKGLVMGVEEIGRQQARLDEEQRRKLRQQSREDLKSLNLTWMNEMVNSDAQLREKMALFWHGHFASRNINILYQQQLLDVIRRNALGNFGDLLRGVSKSAAMINFLNNNQNRKNHPNENFAREVMELFTLGRGNYTENDIKEAARAFTGWGANIPGEFVFRRYQHDEGKKTVLGKSGNFDGDDILNILLENKQTATFISRKIYRFFVNEEADENKVQWLANRFYQSNYNIRSLMEDIFTSEWFYDPKNIGSRIKSPIELMAGIQRMLPMEIQNQEVLLLLQRLLGQILFFPPNVAGWPGGKNWIDSSSLMLRLRLPKMIDAKDELTMSPKDDDDQMMGMKDRPAAKGMNRGTGQPIKAVVHWETFTKNFSRVSNENLVPTIAQVLLQNYGKINEPAIRKYMDNSSRESAVRTAALQLMSTPEYQLC